MKRDKAVAEAIKDLLERQPLAVLATQGEGQQPYTSLMAFAFTEDLRFIVVATTISTRKYSNISGEPRVALLVDDRSNNEEDFHKATALTVLGEACEIALDERSFYSDLYLKRHPSLEDFLVSPSTVLVKINVHNYQLVSKFEDVVEYHFRGEAPRPDKC